MFDNEKLRELLNNLKENMYRYRLEYLKDRNYRDSLTREHAGIIASLENGDREAGIKAVEKHIENQKKAVMEKLRQEEEEKNRAGEKKPLKHGRR